MKQVHTILLLVYIFSIFTVHIQAEPHAEVKRLNGQPTLFIKNSPSPPFAYMSYLGETRFYREAAEAGIHLYCFPAYLGDRGINSTSGIGPFRPAIWVEEDKLDFSSIKKDFEKIILADPQASVIIRIHLDIPQWWDAKHPEECALQPDGTLLRQSFSSDLWRSQAGSILDKCIKWLMASPYARHLVGIHVAGGFTEEWFYHFNGSFSDRSTPRILAFRKWLRGKYNNNEFTLQQSWGTESATFDNALPADLNESEHKNQWRDPVKDRAILDTFGFHTGTMADNIAYFCKIVKDSSEQSLLTGAFYGYLYVTDPRRGHGALAKLLDCPDLDYLSSPNVYNRKIGEDWPPMAAVQSVLLHGKLWMAENDTRTSLTTLLKERAPEICPPGQYESNIWLGPPDIQSSAGLLWKDASRMLCYGYGGWWFDMWGGWFSDPSFQKVLKSTIDNYSKYPIKRDNLTFPQVCVLFDEQLQFLDKGFGKLTGRFLANRETLGKAGAPYDLYLRSDFKNLTTDPYRVIWFMGVPELTAEESGAINQWLASGRTVLWTNLEGTAIYKNKDDNRFQKDHFVWSTGELRELWDQAGVHVYVDTNDVLYAGNGWLSIHTAVKGVKAITLPFAARIIDPLTGKTIAAAESFSVDLDAGATRLFRIERSVSGQ